MCQLAASSQFSASTSHATRLDFADAIARDEIAPRSCSWQRDGFANQNPRVYDTGTHGHAATINSVAPTSTPASNSRPTSKASRPLPTR